MKLNWFVDFFCFSQPMPLHEQTPRLDYTGDQLSRDFWVINVLVFGIALKVILTIVFVVVPKLTTCTHMHRMQDSSGKNISPTCLKSLTCSNVLRKLFLFFNQNMGSFPLTCLRKIIQKSLGNRFF